MKPGIFQQLTLYRYRYMVGYILVALFSISMLTWQLTTLGPGLADAEKASAVHSAMWQMHNWKEAGLQVVNLPYVLLQKTSIAALGLSVLSVRLPSVIIGLGTGALFFLLMRLLHKSHVALSASLLFAAGAWYIGIARFGAPYIMIPFVWTLVAYSLVRLIRLDEPPLAWAALGGLASALALYTPYGIYALVVAGVVVAVHPKIRRNLTALNGPQVVLGLFMLVPLLIPLGWGLFKDYHQLWDLAALSPHIPNPADFIRNIGTTIWALGGRAPLLPELRLGNLPIISLGTSAILLAGVYRSVRDWRSMRAQFTFISILVLLVVIGLNPANKDDSVLILPMFMLVASGVTVLFHEWYRLFPRNPYARSFGLIPIVIFLGFILSFNYQRYFVAWANTPSTYRVYDNDLTLARKQMAAHPNLVLIVPDTQLAFYKVAARAYPKVTVGDATTIQQPDQTILLASSIVPPVPTPVRPLQPIVNDDTDNSLRFWLVTPVQ
ncbi:MAG TPA: glycosyltransferase family 39 protein [Candidatus Saccharimonadales bacterium]|nr:glycosyltransferase family 39 protein [Candidatus Saccharimonadales bacterium]